jgi:hypothetical protein
MSNCTRTIANVVKHRNLRLSGVKLWVNALQTLPDARGQIGTLPSTQWVIGAFVWRRCVPLKIRIGRQRWVQSV